MANPRTRAMSTVPMSKTKCLDGARVNRSSSLPQLPQRQTSDPVGSTSDREDPGLDDPKTPGLFLGFTTRLVRVATC